MDRKDLQRKYVQLQLLKQQLNALLEEKIMLDNKSNELGATVESLKKLDEITKNEEMWSSLGSGAFVRAELRDVKSVMINIGADVFVVKPVGEATGILQSRLTEIEKFDTELVTEINKLGQNIERLEHEMQRLAEAEQKQESRKKSR